MSIYPSSGGGTSYVPTTSSNNTATTTTQPFTITLPDNTNNFNTIEENAKRKLQNNYNDLIRAQVNALNKRGMFGSSVANEDVGKVNYAAGQSLSDLAGTTAAQQISQGNTDVTNQLAVQGLNQQGSQFGQTLAQQKAQQEAANQLAQSQLAQQQAQFQQTLLQQQATQKASQTQAKMQEEMKLAALLGSVDPLNAKSYLNDVLNKYRYL